MSTGSDNANLRRLLVTLYPEPRDARRVAADAELDVRRIEFQGSAEQIWFSLLEEATRSEKTNAVLAYAVSEHPKNEQLASIKAARDALVASAESVVSVALPSQIEKRLVGSAVRDDVQTAVARFARWATARVGTSVSPVELDPMEQADVLLRVAAELVAPSSWDVVTPEDACVLIHAVLSVAAVGSLGEGDLREILRLPPCGAGDPPWPTIWEEYRGDVRRMDGRTLSRLTGRPDPVALPLFGEPITTPEQAAVVGEFVRRHHPRLAADFARKFLGVQPEHRGEALLQVLRSRDGDLRTRLDALRSEELHCLGWPEGHPALVMVLLSLVDYFGAPITSGSAALAFSGVHPSTDEITVYSGVVKRVSMEHADPELLRVVATPRRASEHVTLQELLAEIQHTVDMGWAILGQQHRRHEAPLGLRFRRVCSNLDKLDHTRPYVPIRAELKTAGVELLNLLVAPLYGNTPAIGIRELMQNAVDACRERDDFLAQNPGIGLGVFRDQPADVVVRVDRSGSGSVVVSDRGLGMTQDTVLRYFLTVGASFRGSDEWQRRYTDDGQSRVVRSGRFGVGALAAFLLGPRVRVTTRHVSESRGLRFVYSLDLEMIELEVCDCPVGTEVALDELHPGVATTFAYAAPWTEWYVFQRPSVLHILDGESLATENNAPQDESTQGGWHLVRFPDSCKVFWRYEEFAQLYHNGFFVTEIERITTLVGRRTGEPGKFLDLEVTGPMFKDVSVSLVDPDNRISLTVDRTSMQRDEDVVRVHRAVEESAARRLLAWILVHTPEAPIGPTQYKREITDAQYEGVLAASIQTDIASTRLWYVSNGECFLPRNVALYGAVEVTSLTCLLQLHELELDAWRSWSVSSEAWRTVLLDDGERGDPPWLPDEISTLGRSSSQGKYIGSRLVYNEASAPTIGELSVYNDRNLPAEATRDPSGWFWNSWGKPPPFDATSLPDPLTFTTPVAVMQVFLEPGPNPPLGFARVYLELIGPRPIPLDRELRRRECAAAYEALRDEIAAYERALASE